MTSMRQTLRAWPGNSARLLVGVVVLHLGVAVLVQLGVMAVFKAGTLHSLILPWDDVQYVARNIFNIDRLESSSVTAFLRLRLHAPLADLQTLTVLLLSNLNPIAVFFSNFVFLAATSLFCAYYFREQRGFVWLFALLVVALFPAFYPVPTFIKPDFKGGLLFCMASLLLFEPGASGSNRARMATIAALFLAAVSAKLTAFYLPVVALGTLVLAILVNANWPASLSARGLIALPSVSRQQLMIHALVGAAVVLGYLALALPQLGHLKQYVSYALSDTWNDGLTTVEHLLFFSPFSDRAGKMWASHGLLLAVGASWAWFRGLLSARELRTLAALLTVSAVFTLPLLMARNYHNVEYGSYFYFSVLACLLFLIRALADKLSLRARRILCLVVPLLLAITYSTPRLVMRPALEDAEIIHAALSDISEQVADSDVTGRKRVAFLFDNLFLPPPNLQIIHFKTYGEYISAPRIDQLDALPAGIAEAHFVVASDNAAADGLVDMPSWTVNQQIPGVLASLRRSDDFEERASYEVLDFNLVLFERTGVTASAQE